MVRRVPSPLRRTRSAQIDTSLEFILDAARSCEDVVDRASTEMGAFRCLAVLAGHGVGLGERFLHHCSGVKEPSSSRLRSRQS